MFKRLRKWATFCGFVWLVLALVSEVRAAENYSQISASVSFERRSTVVPLCVASGELRCPKPERYWSIVFVGEKVRYELDQIFAMGSRTAPEFLELEGVLLRPGTRVILEGLVEPVSEDYAFLSKIRDLNLVMDQRANSHVVYPQWECSGVVDDQTHVAAQVWYSGTGRAAKAYKLQVSAENQQGRRMDLAFLQDVTVSSDQDWLTYRGATSLVSADLAIHQAGAAGTQKLPGILKLARLHNQPNQIVVPLEASVELQCVWQGYPH